MSETRGKLRLSDHLRSISIVPCLPAVCIPIIKHAWSRFGAIDVCKLETWVATKEFLLPMKSIYTRVALVPCVSCTVMISDMFAETPFGLVRKISKTIGAPGLSVNMERDRRMIQVALPDNTTREVAYYRDPKWVYASKGKPLPIESTSRIGDITSSVSLESIALLVGEVTGIELPIEWTATRDAIGITYEPALKPKCWHTIDDV